MLMLAVIEIGYDGPPRGLCVFARSGLNDLLL